MILHDVAVASFAVLMLCCLGVHPGHWFGSGSGCLFRWVDPQCFKAHSLHRSRVDRHRDNLSALNPFDPANREVLIVAAFLLAAGWSYLSSEPTHRLVVGLVMMLRGEVCLIFLGLVSQAGILTSELEAAILLRLMIPPEPAALTQ